MYFLLPLLCTLLPFFMLFVPLFPHICYKSPKRRKVSQAFKHLIQNLKTYNRVEDINSVGTRVM